MEIGSGRPCGWWQRNLRLGSMDVASPSRNTVPAGLISRIRLEPATVTWSPTAYGPRSDEHALGRLHSVWAQRQRARRRADDAYEPDVQAEFISVRPHREHEQSAKPRSCVSSVPTRRSIAAGHEQAEDGPGDSEASTFERHLRHSK